MRIGRCVKVIVCSGLLLILSIEAFAQDADFQRIKAEVQFDQPLREWDGFGFNYVEAAQTRDYQGNPQDYGGFSLLSEKQKEEIIELIFSESGLHVQIVKMFLDPYHQITPEAIFNHRLTTENMLDFVTQGNLKTRERGDQLEIITTLYGPPPWATRQKFIGGRDLDPELSENLGQYMADWVRFLQDQNLPVKYLSLHNEGEDFYRWDFREGTQRLPGFDYNMYWSPEQVNQFLKIMPVLLKKRGLNDIQLTNGEPSNWYRFYYWNYADALVEDSVAINNLGLLTSHGFINGDMGKLSYGPANSLTTDLIRTERPELHAWTTSFSWGNMGVDFIRMAHENIYAAKVNAIIPWAGIQNPESWIDGDPNPGTAIIVRSDGSYEITNGYYFYKQLTRAGHRGMQVAKTLLSNPQAHIIAFAQDNTNHPDAFVLTSNIYIWSLPIEIKIKGSKYHQFKAFRSTEDGKEKFTELGVYPVKDGSIIYDPPKGSTTTFIGIR